MTSTCQACGAKLDAGDLFCGDCGAKAQPSSAAESNAAPVAPKRVSAKPPPLAMILLERTMIMFLATVCGALLLFGIAMTLVGDVSRMPGVAPLIIGVSFAAPVVALFALGFKKLLATFRGRSIVGKGWLFPVAGGAGGAVLLALPIMNGFEKADLASFVVAATIVSVISLQVLDVIFGGAKGRR